MDIPKNVLNPDLYRKARKKADETYKKNSAYKSMFIVSTYKKLGGKYSGTKENKGVKRWNNEKWIQVVPFLESGKKIACGFGSDSKGCRPSKRIDKETPITIQELLKKHNKNDLLKVARQKKKDMSKRVNWNKLEIK
tara:strand:- start:358 stop:768 length:411 start_codon:yes stop_codon:yes gene_type:complete